MDIPAEAAAQRTEVCALDDILPDTGICVLVGGQQIAVFRVGDGEQLYALDNRDPFSGAHVLSRGLICSLGGRLCVASPIYKQHFDMQTGLCLEDETRSVRTYKTVMMEGRVCVVVG